MGIFLVFVATLFLLPLVLSFLKTVMTQSKHSLWDRNRKTARELAGSSLIDYMRTFAMDYNRDVFSGMYLNRNNPTFAGLGSSTSTLSADPIQRTIFVSTRGRYQPGNVEARAAGDKGLNGLFYFRSDLTRFDMYWNNPAMDMVAFLDNAAFCAPAAPSWTHSGSIWVAGRLKTIGCKPNFQNGVLVVPGDFETDSDTTLGPNFRVFCRKLIGTPTLVGGGEVVVYSSNTTPVNPYGNNPFFPDLAIADLNPGRNMDYFLTRNSTEVVTTEDINVTFQPGGTVDFYFPVAAATSTLVLPSSATIVVSGSSITVSGVITRPTTLVARTSGGSGGDITVTDSLTYLNGLHAASLTNNLAVIAQGRLKFDSAAAQDVDGFYYTASGQVQILQDHALTMHGSLYGMIQVCQMSNPSVQLNISPDRELIKYYPPYMPRKPYVATWDYVP